MISTMASLPWVKTQGSDLSVAWWGRLDLLLGPGSSTEAKLHRYVTYRVPS